MLGLVSTTKGEHFYVGIGLKGSHLSSICQEVEPYASQELLNSCKYKENFIWERYAHGTKGGSSQQMTQFWIAQSVASHILLTTYFSSNSGLFGRTS
jgi:hypothetical protein